MMLQDYFTQLRNLVEENAYRHTVHPDIEAVSSEAICTAAKQAYRPGRHGRHFLTLHPPLRRSVIRVVYLLAGCLHPRERVRVQSDSQTQMKLTVQEGRFTLSLEDIGTGKIRIEAASLFARPWSFEVAEDEVTTTLAQWLQRAAGPPMSAATMTTSGESVTQAFAQVTPLLAPSKARGLGAILWDDRHLRDFLIGYAACSIPIAFFADAGLWSFAGSLALGLGIGTSLRLLRLVWRDKVGETLHMSLDGSRVRRPVAALEDAHVVSIDGNHFDLNDGPFTTNVYEGLFREPLVELRRAQECLRFSVAGVEVSRCDKLDDYALPMPHGIFEAYIWPAVLAYSDVYNTVPSAAVRRAIAELKPREIGASIEVEDEIPGVEATDFNWPSVPQMYGMEEMLSQEYLSGEGRATGPSDAGDELLRMWDEAEALQSK